MQSAALNRPSVRLSEALMYRGQIGCNTRKALKRTFSLGVITPLAPTRATVPQERPQLSGGRHRPRRSPPTCSVTCLVTRAEAGYGQNPPPDKIPPP